MPALTASIHVTRGGTLDWTFELHESDGTTVVNLALTDVVRVKIYRGDQATPDLDLDQAVNANGSVVTVDDRGDESTAASCTLRLAQGDTLNLSHVCYDVEVGIVDDSETAPADAYKPVQQAVLHVLSGPAGDKGTS